MHPKQEAALSLFLERYREKAEFIGILLAGSLAHGYAKDRSDIDIILVASEEEYAQRVRDSNLAFSLWDICEYDGGYVDCKVVSLSSLRTVAERGSDAARYAFKDAKVLVSRSDELEPLLERVVRFPVEQAAQREHRFVCQLLAWKWYLSQAEEKDNNYLRHLACQKLSLFACRIVLNRNQMLYPYHKWMLKEVGQAKEKPANFDEELEAFLASPTFAQAQGIADGLLLLLELEEKKVDWPNQFMTDSELNWLDQEAPVDDL